MPLFQNESSNETFHMKMIRLYLHENDPAGEHIFILMWFQTVARFDAGTNTNSEEAAYFDLRIFYKVIFRNNSGDLPKLMSTNSTKPEQKMIKGEVGNLQALSL